MNRRTFLKSIAIACGAAVVCPGELVKSPVEFRPNPAQKAIMDRRLRFGIGERSKHIYIYGKHYIMYNKRLSEFIVTPYEPHQI